jgi:translocation and assembly module TamB
MNFLQAELLGGTLRARALLDLRPVVPVVSAEALFTNLDLDRLVSRVAELRPGAEESSISGEGSLRVPLLDQRRTFLEGLTLSARLRHIGAKSLDRALVSLDPYERNEAIMAQRKLLRLGRLQRAEVEVADGALSLSGAINIEDATIDLPKIHRLRLAELPLNKELAPLLAAISAVRPPLEFIRADTIAISAQGEISLRKEEK